MATRIEAARHELLGNTRRSGNQEVIKAARESYRKICGVETKGERAQRRRAEKESEWQNFRIQRVLARVLSVGLGHDGSDLTTFNAEVRYLASMGITIEMTETPTR